MKQFIIILFLFYFIFYSYSDNTSSNNPVEGSKSNIREEPLFLIKVIPAYGLPISDSRDLLKFGIGADLNFQYAFRFYRNLSLALNLGYFAEPVQADVNMSVINAGLGLAVNFPIGKRFILGAGAHGGYYHGFIHDNSGINSGNPYIYAGANFAVRLKSYLSLGIEAGYRNYFGMSQEMVFGMCVNIHLNKKRIHALEPGQLEVNPLFPSLYNVHNKNSIGSISFLNILEFPVENLHINYRVEGIMDKPAECEVPDVIAPGEEVKITLPGELNNNLLSISETTELDVEMDVEYRSDHKKGEERIKTQTLVYRKNDIIWDDLRKAVVFIAEAHPELVYLSNETKPLVKKNEKLSVNENLIKIIALYESLRQIGISYKESLTPYDEYSANINLIDSIQLPDELLLNKAGDCAELSILFASLVETAGLKSALLSVPGNMLAAVYLDMNTEQAEEEFSYSDKLIYVNDTAWLPVDMKNIGNSFLTAWQSGAAIWYESPEEMRTAFIINDLKEDYTPVQWDANNTNLYVTDNFSQSFHELLMEYISWEIEPEADILKQQLEDNPNDPVTNNNIGVLYAKYGLYEEAIPFFYKITLRYEYVPALINMGHVHYISGELKKALPFYERAYNEAAFDPVILLSIAKINYALENYGSARDAYDKLKSIDPELASEYDYLELVGDEARLRARETMEKEIILWEEE